MASEASGVARYTLDNFNRRASQLSARSVGRRNDSAQLQSASFSTSTHIGFGISSVRDLK